MQVLFVDDERDVLEQAKIFLEKEDYRLNIKTTSSPKKALEMLEEDDFVAIVLDYQMPVMDGLELLKNLREDKESDIPFIMFTGRGREEVAMEALNLGADRYLQKGGDPRSQYGVLAKAIIQETEHWSTKKKLTSSEKKYKDLTEESLVGIYIIQDDVFKYVNPEFCDIFGYEKEELIGKKYLELVAPEERDNVKDGVQKRQKREGGPVRYNFKALKKSGERIIVEVFSTPSTYHNRPAVQGTLIDITKRKESRKEYQNLINSINDFIFILDLEGNIISVNDVATKKLGYSKEELVKMNLHDLDTPPNISKIEKRVKKLREEGSAVFSDRDSSTLR